MDAIIGLTVVVTLMYLIVCFAIDVPPFGFIIVPVFNLIGFLYNSFIGALDRRKTLMYADVCYHCGKHKIQATQFSLVKVGIKKKPICEKCVNDVIAGPIS